MSFFGFDQAQDLEEERRKFLAGGAGKQEDVAVFTWGEESYDGLGEALQEGGRVRDLDVAAHSRVQSSNLKTVQRVA